MKGYWFLDSMAHNIEITLPCSVNGNPKNNYAPNSRKFHEVSFLHSVFSSISMFQATMVLLDMNTGNTDQSPAIRFSKKMVD